jgi:outer membrane protein assembly factor BamB
LLAPLALGGCGLWDDWFGTKKTPLAGKRESIMSSQRGLTVDDTAGKVVLPPIVRNAAWPQFGGNPSHYMGHLAANDRLAEAWTAKIGEGGGYRRIIMAQPVVEAGIVYAMDSDAEVSAFKLATGELLWRFDTKSKDADSTNVGGGLAVDQGTLYAVNGLADMVALDAVKGTQRWRIDIVVPARSAPTVSNGRIFVTTMEDRLLAVASDDGRFLWSHGASDVMTQMLGQAAPATAQGLVVAGFGSGELSAMRADSGTVVWTDGLGAGHAGGGSAIADFQSIRAAPVLDSGRVYAIGMGGLAVAIDLPTGRRLWERQVTGEDTPWVAGDWMFVISVDQELAAINASDGRVAWVTPLPRWDDPQKQKDGLTWYGPALVSDRLVVAGTTSELLSLSPYTGEILGHQTLSGSAAPFPPVVADGFLLVVSDDGRLLALR